MYGTFLCFKVYIISSSTTKFYGFLLQNSGHGYRHAVPILSEIYSSVLWPNRFSGVFPIYKAPQVSHNIRYRQHEYPYCAPPREHHKKLAGGREISGRGQPGRGWPGFRNNTDLSYKKYRFRTNIKINNGHIYTIKVFNLKSKKFIKM